MWPCPPAPRRDPTENAPACVRSLSWTLSRKWCLGDAAEAQTKTRKAMTDMYRQLDLKSHIRSAGYRSSFRMARDLLGCILFLGLSPGASAAVPLEYRSQIETSIGGGLVSDMVATSTHAYVLTSRKLLIVDLQNLPDLSFIETRNSWGGQSLCLWQNQLFIVSAWRDMYVLDVTNPESPIRRDSDTYTAEVGAELVDVSQFDDHLFVVGSGAVVRGFELPSLNLLGKPNYTGRGHAGAADSGVFYLTTGNDHPGIRVMPLLDTWVPGKRAQSLRTPGLATDVVAANGYSYVACRNGGLTVVDGRNPSAPLVKSTTPLAGYVDRLALQGNRLYAGLETTGRARLQVLSLPTAGNPVPEAWIETRGHPPSESVGGVAVLDHRVLLATTTDPYSTEARARILLASTMKAPTILAQPQDQILWVGQPLELSVTASATTTIQYQWYQGEDASTSTPIAGATSPTFSIPAASSTAAYWVRVSSLGESSDSQPARVLVASEPFLQTLRGAGSQLTLRLIAKPGTSWRLIRSRNARDWFPEPEVFSLETAVVDVARIQTDGDLEFFQCLREP